MRLVLARHGETEKNVQSRHGGVPDVLTGLTPRGRDQVHQLADWLRAANCGSGRIVHTSRRQCRATAAILSSELAMLTEERDVIPAFYLGVLDGLSDAEAEARHPDAARRMTAYRRGLLEIADLQLPGSTDPDAYFAIAAAEVDHICRSRLPCIVVASRSVLIVMASVLLDRRPVRGGGYREIPWPNAGVMTFSVGEGRAVRDESRTTVSID